ncbi:MAG: Ig-like domain-containing domain [Flavobacteriales bacterium]
MKVSAPFLYLSVGLLCGCAQVREPQGGPKDTTPPKLVSSSPDLGSVRFSGQRIILHFDEPVKLDQVGQRLLISPPLSAQPDVAVSRASDITISLKAPLQANTTYSFNLGGCVMDLTEGNRVDDLAFVVSTGDHIDSLAIHGNVTEAITGLPSPDMWVLLHAIEDTGDVRTSLPDFFTRTDASGNFRLSHLRGGNYHINALQDKNTNYRFDLPNEEVAFLDRTVDPNDSEVVHLFLFRPVSKTQFVVSAMVQPDRGWQLAMARRTGHLELHSLDRSGGTLSWWPEWNASRDTVVMWPSDTTLLMGQRFNVLEDGNVLDTIRYRSTVPMPYYLKVELARDPETGGFSLTSTRPIEGFQLEHFVLHEDSVVLPLNAELDTVQRRTLHLDLGANSRKPMDLVLYPNAITDMQGGTNDTTRLSVGVPDPHSLGKLTLQVVTDSTHMVKGPLILQLLTVQNHTVRQVESQNLPIIVTWEGLSPAEYHVRLIRDTDGNGSWSTGSMVDDVQPERVHLLATPITVRAGWAVEETWKFAEQH